MRNENWFDSVAMVTCTDNDKTIEADVVDFRESRYLSVSMNTVRVSLQYEPKFNQSVGSMGGMEFVSKGPKRVG